MSNNGLNTYEKLNSENIENDSEFAPATTSNTYREVLDKNANIIGTVKQIIKNHREKVAVFSFKESLGLGKKYYLIPTKSFSTDLNTNRFILDFDFDFIRNAPAFSENDWPDDIDSYIEKKLNYWSK